MASLSHYALPGIVVLSALGALIMCLLVFRYGFTSPGDEDPEAAEHRLFVTRFGHALVAVCFATAAMLAVVAFSAQVRTARLPTPAVGEASAAETVRRLEERVDRRLAELEQRLTEVAATVERAAEAPAPPAPSTARRPARAELSLAPARRSEPEATTTPALRSSTPVTDEEVSALPADVRTHQLRATVQGIGVDVLSGAGHGGQTVYAVRLSDVGGQPLVGVDVALLGRMADGSAVRVPLTAANEPGLYRGRVASAVEGPSELRLRIVTSDRRFELSLAQAVSW